MVEGSHVDYHALGKFGSDTSNTLQTYQGAIGGPQAMISLGSLAGASLGTNEAQTFKDYYDQGILDPAQCFLKDSPTGMMSIQFGATVCAANYADGDQSQADGMKVVATFNADPNKGLDADLAKHNKDVTTKTKVDLPHSENLPKTPTEPNVCLANPTPMEQLQMHDHEYGKWETWRPVDPNAPVDIDPSTVEPLGPGNI